MYQHNVDICTQSAQPPTTHPKGIQCLMGREVLVHAPCLHMYQTGVHVERTIRERLQHMLTSEGSCSDMICSGNRCENSSSPDGLSGSFCDQM